MLTSKVVKLKMRSCDSGGGLSSLHQGDDSSYFLRGEIPEHVTYSFSHPWSLACSCSSAPRCPLGVLSQPVVWPRTVLAPPVLNNTSSVFSKG